MANNLTGILSIAASGLMQGSGLTVNPDMNTEVTAFNQNSLIAETQRILAYNNAQFDSALSRLPPFMTGQLPAGITVNGINARNVPESVLSQANKIFPNAQVFIQVFEQAQSYVTKSANFKRTLRQAQNTKFTDLGFQYQNYTDVMTGGITNQFDTAYLPVLSAEFKNLGTMFDMRSLAKLDDPGALIKNLLRQGLGIVANLDSRVTATKIDLANTDEFDRTQLTEILSTITGTDLATIVETTKFKAYQPAAITDLSKVLIAANIFSADAIRAFMPHGTMSDLARKLGNIGGTFNNAESLSKFYSSLNHKNFSNLNQLTALMTPAMVTASQAAIGQGTGTDGSVTMVDMLGTAAGVGYVEDLKGINRLLDYLIANDSDVIALRTALQAVTESTTDLTELLTKIDAVIGKNGIQVIIDDGNRAMINMAERLKIEITNLSLAGIVPESFAPNNDSVFSFVDTLHSIGQSAANVGSRTLLEKLATKNVYGEAIEAAILEGQNINNFSAVGIDTKTKLA